MTAFQDLMQAYKKQLKDGQIQQAYLGLMRYMLELRTHFKTTHPDFAVSNNLYFGYMDMTYFACFPPALKARNLKIAVVFIHPTFRFEAWLAGINKSVQTQYWKQFKASQWNKYHLVSKLRGADSILEHTLVTDPDFGDLPTLTAEIEQGTLAFIQDIQAYLSQA